MFKILLQQRNCPERHPRHCRFWTSKSEGCRRKEKCQYLHVIGKRFSEEELTSRRKLSTVHEHEREEEESEGATVPCDERAMAYHDRRDLNAHRQTQHGQGFSSGDQCNIFQDNREAAQNHRGSSDGDEEEIYVVTKSNNGKVEFECKLCDKTFDTQKSVKQHGTMKHGSFY